MSRCWIFSGSLASGYGRAWWDGRVLSVHRAAYEALVGPIPEGYDLDHLCRNRACYTTRTILSPSPDPRTPGGDSSPGAQRPGTEPSACMGTINADAK
ncbi:MAG: HNH endonuclease signature motif containing protein, partial [bacterium]